MNLAQHALRECGLMKPSKPVAKHGGYSPALDKLNDNIETIKLLISKGGNAHTIAKKIGISRNSVTANIDKVIGAGTLETLKSNARLILSLDVESRQAYKKMIEAI